MKKIQLFIYRDCINRPHYWVSGSAKYGCNVFFLRAVWIRDSERVDLRGTRFFFVLFSMRPSKTKRIQNSSRNILHTHWTVIWFIPPACRCERRSRFIRLQCFLNWYHVTRDRSCPFAVSVLCDVSVLSRSVRVMRIRFRRKLLTRDAEQNDERE